MDNLKLDLRCFINYLSFATFYFLLVTFIPWLRLQTLKMPSVKSRFILKLYRAIYVIFVNET